MKSNYFLFLGSLILLLTGACQRRNKDLQVLPPNSVLVMKIDGEKLIEKSGYTDFSQTALYKKLHDRDEQGAQQMQALKPYLEQPGLSGIHFKSSFYVFYYHKAPDNYMALSFRLKDREKFERFQEKIQQERSIPDTILHQGRYSSLAFRAQNGLALWNDEQLLFLFSEKASQNAMLQEAKNLFTQKNTIEDNSDFAAFDKQNADISLWANLGEGFNLLPAPQRAMLIMQLPSGIDDTYWHLTGHFEKGKVVLNSEIVPNELLMALIQTNSLLKPSFDRNALRAIPKNSLAHLSLAFNTTGLYELVARNKNTLARLDKAAEEAYGMSLKQLLMQFSGELSINLHDINFKEVERFDYQAFYENHGQEDQNKYVKNTLKPFPLYDVVVKMNDDLLWKNFMKKQQQHWIKKEGYYQSSGNNSWYVGFFKPLILWTNDEQWIKKMASGKSSDATANQTLYQALGEYPAYGMVDLGKLQQSDSMQQYTQQQLPAGDSHKLGLIRKIEFKSNSLLKNELIFQLDNKRENSLKVLLHRNEEKDMAGL